MQEHRRYPRIRPAGLVSRTGKIIIDPKKPALECTVIDLSAGGACLDIGDNKVPPRFVFMHGGTRKSCRVMWSKGRRVGVAF